jgi:UDP-glucuronate 4-epimerase
MKVLVTGVAGFIGYHLTKRLLLNGHTVFGIDNINDYYSQELKIDRLNELGLNREDVIVEYKECKSNKYENLHFYKFDLTNADFLSKQFGKISIDKICHLAAQPGVRYSIENPKAYIQSNIVAYLNVLEFARNNRINHFIYASSSSVYGESSDVPFSESSVVDKPVSLYAATKKSNELMAYTYSHLYGIETIGLRFFTVYGPWGRPDMAYFSFSKLILEDGIINLYNYGEMMRDFTYIDDIIEGIIRIIEVNKNDNLKYKIYNIGNNKAEKLIDFVNQLETVFEKKANINLFPMQPGDVTSTFANVDELIKDFGFSPNTSIKEGLQKFALWFKYYFQNKRY